MEQDICLWFCRLEAEQVPAALLQELPADQALRLGQMTRTPARQQRLLAWWLRNRLLAEQLGVGVGDLQFAEQAHGKPCLTGPQAALHFNLSHTKGCVAVACGPWPLGLDVEPAARPADWARVGRRMFSAAEQSLLETAAPPQQARLAAALWSAREAWAKAGGRGLAGFAEDPPFALVDGRWQPPAGAFRQYELPAHVLSLAVPRALDTLAVQVCEISLQPGADGWRLRRKSAKLSEMESSSG